MNVWIGVVAALVGAIVGGSIAIINTRFQLREQRLREKNKLFLSKMEEIHEALSQFKDAYKAAFGERLLTAYDANTPEKNEKNLPKVPIEKIQMLVGFYAPELKTHLSNLEEAKKSYGKMLIESLGLERRVDLDKRESLSAMLAVEGKINAVCTDMQIEVIKLSKEYL
jgi:hypothetical protein